MEADCLDTEWNFDDDDEETDPSKQVCNESDRRLMAVKRLTRTYQIIIC